MYLRSLNLLSALNLGLFEQSHKLLFFTSSIIAVLVIMGSPYGMAANKKSNAIVLSEDQLVKKLTHDLLAMSDNIVSIRPGRIRDSRRHDFQLIWAPTIIIKKGLGEAKQVDLAKNIAEYMVAFQGGVPDKQFNKKPSAGGILFFIEGMGWHPTLARVAYKFESHKPPLIYVIAEFRYRDGKQRIRCCKKKQKIGRIIDTGFIRQ